MKLNYDQKTDSLYIELSEKPSVDSNEVSNGVVLDFDKVGNLVGIDVQHASQILDLNHLETGSLPLASAGK
jgi:uncharacterized protein YuzE